jgi:hypothetical protein
MVTFASRSAHSSFDGASDVLSTDGIASFGRLYPAAAVAGWNAELDPLFASGDQVRATLGADVLAATGVLAGVLTPPIRALIAQTVPDARIYHAHAYEIAGGNERPHIHSEHLDGWHRDTETIRDFQPDRARHISLFVYLTDVHDDSGAFEFLPRSPRQSLGTSQEAHRVTGPAGTTFAWNRSYYHRASPNTSAVRRRLVKLSWQPAGLANDRIKLPEFAAAVQNSEPDEWLEVLLGAKGDSRRLPSVSGTSPAIQPLPLDTTVDARRTDRLTERVRVLRHRVGP